MSSPAHARWSAAKAALGFMNLKLTDARERVRYLEAELKAATYALDQVALLQKLADAEVTASAGAMSEEARNEAAWKP